MLLGLTNLADAFGMEIIWGEATASSAAFYEKMLQIRPVKDLFIIGRREMRSIQEYHREKQQSSLEKIQKRGQRG